VKEKYMTIYNNKTTVFRVAKLIALLFLLPWLSTCFLFTPLVPEIDDGDVTIRSGEMHSITVSITDDTPGVESGDYTFEWYIDDELQDEAESTFLFPAKLVSSDKKYEVSVKVIDEFGAFGEDSATITIEPSSYGLLEQTGEFTYTVDLGSKDSDVYFIFTNTSETDVSKTKISANVTRGVTHAVSPDRSQMPPPPEPSYTKDLPEAVAFWEDLPPLRNGYSRMDDTIGDPPPPSFDEEDATEIDFQEGSSDPLVTATCRAISSAHGKTVNVYVENTEYLPDYPGTGTISEAMADNLATTFLQAGDNNDIYEWVTNIYGDEWGDHGYSNLIPPDDQITILLLDIDSDGEDGVVAGYFWPKDNYTDISNSNERIMFYIDSWYYANNPDEGISTVAHEFQHVIHFYQKWVVAGVSTDTWYNEMCSLISEDLSAKKLQIPGPRGVSYSDGSAGSSGNTSSTLSYFNYYNDESLTTWDGSFIDYTTAYAFGAFLARNYGGAGLFKDLVQGSLANTSGVASAAGNEGGGSFSELLQKWGVATLLSDDTDAEDGVRYNKGDFFDSSTGGVTYEVGSINLYNYKYDTLEGPSIYSSSPVGAYSQQYGTSNVYFLAGTDLDGEQSWDIDMPDDVLMSVVFK
jgi:hypothetical protein